MAKPTHASVTEEPCKCGSLQSGADDPRSPIVFDAEMNEYHFEYTRPCSDGQREPGKAYMMIYHCPFCGGAAPESKRGLLFAVIPPEEAERLAQLLRGIKSFEDAVLILGKPDDDNLSGQLTYSCLSDTAQVIVNNYSQDGSVHAMYAGKYIGPPRKRTP